MRKAILLIVPEDDAEDMSRLIAATLSMNGYGHDGPSVIDWPIVPKKPAPIGFGNF